MQGASLTWGALLPFLAFIFFPGDSAAQQIPSPFRYVEEAQEAGPFVAYLDADAGRFGFGPEPGVAFGARYGLDVSGPLGLEGSTIFFPTSRDVVNLRLGEANRRVDVADMALLLVDARLRFSLTGRRTWHGIAPYLVAGGGLGFDLAGNQEGDQKLQQEDRFEFGTGFLGLLGGGLRVTLGGPLVARGDAQLTLWQLDTPQGFQGEDLGFDEIPTNEWVSNGLFSLGFSYRF
jgi:hypothetical protein